MDYREAPPSPRLSQFIKCFWSLDYQQHGSDSAPEPVLPDGCPEIIFNQSDRFIRTGAVSDETQAATIIAGQLTHHLLIRPSGRVSLFGVRFWPSGASQFLGFPLVEVTNQTVDIFSAMGSFGRMIEEEVSAASGFAERVAIFERHVLARVAAARSDHLARAASSVILRSSGRTQISALAMKLGVSERKLERRFAASVGVSPKMLSRIVRFQAAIHAIKSANRRDLLDRALELGYYDQSHLIRDFKAFSGVTPTRYSEAVHDISDVFTGSTNT